ncbi:MAG: D-TA family PLP-dependent enzyme [Gemmataceae bacterium]|nr:D-TA family PLP-dependent enzyme [Gemmataceae bacterium]MDW8264913.1 D-TA family PLP-dependent enzyme [Gemmataceae bacterium]
MDLRYLLDDPSSVLSPGLLFYEDLIRQNIARTIEIAGGPERLRPHVKTHKTREIVRMQLAAGITKHKCATIAEAELLADCGVPDVLLAYPLVGPNCARLARLVAAYPRCRFSTLVDHPASARALSAAFAHGPGIDVVLDIDPGQHRTGVAPGPEAIALYELVAKLPGLRPDGLHIYDGHHHQESRADRESAVSRLVDQVLTLRDTLVARQLPVPRLVLGGTPTFPIYAAMNLPGQECAPGTCILHDYGYGSRFPDLTGYVWAALLLTRVVSRPTSERVTLDLGYKAVASDPPADRRCWLLNIPEARIVLQNEEHLVVETPAAPRFTPGDVVYAVPTHICPTVALHRQANVVRGGQVVGTWEIAARDRMLHY